MGSGDVRLRMQVGCSRVFAILPTSPATAGHPEGSHPTGLVHGAKYISAASIFRDGNRSVSVRCIQVALHAWRRCPYLMRYTHFK